MKFTNSTIGVPYCNPGVSNSTGTDAKMSANGSQSAPDNDVTLVAIDLPVNTFGFFLTSQIQGLSTNPGGSQGTLCLGGAIGRYVGPGQIQNSGHLGTMSLTIDLAAMPTPAGPIAVVAGETWNFQAWYRDAVGGVPTSNFAHGLEIVFL